MVITLCGSTKFKDDFLIIMRGLTLQGHVVMCPGVFGHADKLPLTAEQKVMLDKIHFKKIDMSDAIYVVNRNNYIGKSTREEILYAKGKDLKIIYHEATRFADLP